MSDISDGIEKGIVTLQGFAREFRKMWKELYKRQKCPVRIRQTATSFNQEVSIPWSKKTMEEAVERFFECHEDFYFGRQSDLIPEDGMGRVLKTMKEVSKKILYSSVHAESIELTGYAVITGILKQYERILLMPNKVFSKLVEGESVDGYDYEKRLFHRLGRRCVQAYKYEIETITNESPDMYLTKELWYRIHLIIDHVSGMTDEYALETYQMLEGISLLKK